MVFWVNSLTSFAEVSASSLLSKGSHFFRISLASGSATPMPWILVYAGSVLVMLLESFLFLVLMIRAPL